MGATPHSVFSVAPKGSGQPSSHAVPGMWGMHKLRQNYAQGTTPATAGENPLSQFLQSFFTTSSNVAKVNQVHSNYHNQIKVASPKDFFAALLVDLLDGIKALIDDVLVLLNDLIDGFIDAAEGIVDLIGAAAGVDIPILSALWKALTGNDLTFLDLIAFVVAIPVTLVYRVVEGGYPGDQSLAGASAAANQILARVQGMTGAITALLGGIFTAIFDALDAIEVEANLLAKVILVTVSAGIASALVEGDVLTQSGWNILISIGALVPLVLANIPEMPPEIPSVTGFITSVLVLVGAALRYESSEKEEVDKLDLSADVISALPLVVNPIKFSESLAAVVPPVADLACGLAVFGLTLGSTIKDWDELPPPTAITEPVEPVAPPSDHRVFLPTVQR